MSVQAIVNDVRGRVEPLVTKSQTVVELGVDALLKANDVVFDGVQSLLKTQVEAGRDLLAAVQTSFAKAKKAGLQKVASAPVDYLPDGRERVISAYNDTFTLVTKTSDEVAKIVKTGYASVSAELTGAPARKAAPAKKAVAKPAAKKAPAKKRATKKASA